jgi:hypothetical protein
LNETGEGICNDRHYGLDWDNNSINIEEHRKKLEGLYENIYDHLGEETLLTWYEEFPQKYSLEKIKKLRR